MLTRLTVRNFKRFEQAEIELANPVVLIGPNNSGKTSALQALALWHAGLRRWNEKRGGASTLEKRPGVAVNRRDLVAMPVPAANLLWHELRTRNALRSEGKQRTENIRVEIIVDGIGRDGQWRCGSEVRLDRGAVDVRIGEAWQRREIENYLCTPATLEAFADATARDAVGGRLWEAREVEKRLGAMGDAIAEIESALQALRQASPWDPSTKVSDDFLTPLFAAYFEKLDLPNLMLKRSFYELAEHVPLEEIDPEVTEKLDAIGRVAADGSVQLA